MSKSRESVATRMKRSSQLNQKLFDSYFEQQKEKGKNVTTVSSALSKIIEAAEHKDINQLEIEDIRKAFIKMKVAPSTSNSRIDLFKTFLRFATEKVTLQFDIDDLDDLRVEETKKEDMWEALSIDDVIALRLKLREIDDPKLYKALYYFEMFYAFGLETDELLNLHSGNYDEAEKKFHFQGTDYALPSQLHDIPRNQIIPNKRLNQTAPSYHLKKIETIFSRNVTAGDIIATRNRNFFKCPRCEGMYEANPENWVVFHYEIDDSRWIVCRAKCLEGGLNE